MFKPYTQTLVPQHQRSPPMLHRRAQVACELELWQEAFRSVEDIQGLSAIGKKPPKPQLMALYYAKLTQIFTVSEAHLYNGYGTDSGRRLRALAGLHA